MGDGNEAAVAASGKEGAQEDFSCSVWEVVDFKDGGLAEEAAEGGGLRVAGIEEVGAPGFCPTDRAECVVVTAPAWVGSQPGDGEFSGEAVVVFKIGPVRPDWGFRFSTPAGLSRFPRGGKMNGVPEQRKCLGHFHHLNRVRPPRGDEGGGNDGDFHWTHLSKK